MTEAKASKGGASPSHFLTKQAFHTESIEKERTIRKQWTQKFCPEKIEQEKEALIRSIRDQQERDKLRKERKNSPTRKLIYEGVSKEGGGRASYLRARKEESPTKKNKFPPTSSQEVGWLIEQRFLEGKRSEDTSNATRKGKFSKLSLRSKPFSANKILLQKRWCF